MARTYVKRMCENPECRKEFEALPKDVRKGRYKACSLACKGKLQRKKANTACYSCGASIRRTRTTKSGLFFCGRTCKEKAQQIGGPLALPHYRKGRHSYRSKAKKELGLTACNRCGYNKVTAILQVHHKDRDRDNNTKENLEVLCPNCHYEDHFAAKDGIYTGAP